MIKLNSGKPDDKKLFLTYQNYVLEHDNPTILCQTFFQNLTHHKHVFFRLQNTNKLYQQLLKYDIRMKSNFGQHDQFSMVNLHLFSCSILSLESSLNMMSTRSSSFLQTSSKDWPDLETIKLFWRRLSMVFCLSSKHLQRNKS